MIALLAAAALLAGEATPRQPVDVRAGGSDGLTQQLSEAMIQSLASASRMRATNGDEDPTLALVIVGNVEPAGSRFDYIVDLMRIDERARPERLASMKGRCGESAIAACAADIVAKANRKVKG